MYAVRLWSVRRARFLETVYNGFERVLRKLHPVFHLVGYARLEQPMAMAERTIKGFLFDCQMCGQCVLSATGMSCPMNCPKQLRNGPCGGVRANGNCEVKPDMRCVWVEAESGARRMRASEQVHAVQFAVDSQANGRSSWLRVAREDHPVNPITSGLKA